MKPKRDKKLMELMLMCKIRPLQRPRKTTHFYQPKENQKELFIALEPYKHIHINEPVIIDMTIMFARGKKHRSPFKSDYPTQKQFGDEDNLRKAINDAMVEHGILYDDSLIIGGETFKIFAEENMAHITVYSPKTAT